MTKTWTFNSAEELGESIYNTMTTDSIITEAVTNAVLHYLINNATLHLRRMFVNELIGKISDKN